MENSKIKILIVEDEPAVSKPLADDLRDEGFEVLIAPNGMEGYSLALERKPDLILLDLLMPVMDGLTMMEKLRESDKLWAKSVPIIILTNLSAGEERIMKVITKHEPAYFLVKSDWTLKEVVGKIRDRLANKV